MLVVGKHFGGEKYTFPSPFGFLFYFVASVLDPKPIFIVTTRNSAEIVGSLKVIEFTLMASFSFALPVLPELILTTSHKISTFLEIAGFSNIATWVSSRKKRESQN